MTKVKIKPEVLIHRSGGPKTPEGKAVSSMNAIKHGVLSNTLSELDRVDPVFLFESLCTEFKAESCHQKMLIEQLVFCYIKLSRCSRIESDILRESLYTTHDPFKVLDVGGDIIDEDKRAMVNDQTMKKLELLLIRYEPQLIKRMMTLIDTLKKLQGNAL